MAKVDKRENKKMCLDKGYDSGEARDWMKEFGYTAHICPHAEEAQAAKREAPFKARRWVLSWKNRFCHILIRWEKKPEYYLFLLHFV